jgi:hypothetical protein
MQRSANFDKLLSNLSAPDGKLPKKNTNDIPPPPPPAPPAQPNSTANFPKPPPIPQLPSFSDAPKETIITQRSDLIRLRSFGPGFEIGVVPSPPDKIWNGTLSFVHRIYRTDDGFVIAGDFFNQGSQPEHPHDIRLIYRASDGKPLDTKLIETSSEELKPGEKLLYNFTLKKLPAPEMVPGFELESRKEREPQKHELLGLLQGIKISTGCDNRIFHTAETYLNVQDENRQYALGKFLLQSQENLSAFSTYVEAQINHACGGHVPENGLDVNICGNEAQGSGCSTLFRIQKERSDPWKVTSNQLQYLVPMIDRQRAQQTAVQQQQVRKQDLRRKFLSDNSAVTIVDAQQLQRNPFPYKDKIIGVYVVFGRMTSENSAIFTSPNEIPVLSANKVPATMFTSNILVVLAIQVNGLKDGLVDGNLVGQYFCQQQGCTDFF